MSSERLIPISDDGRELTVKSITRRSLCAAGAATAGAALVGATPEITTISFEISLEGWQGWLRFWKARNLQKLRLPSGVQHLKLGPVTSNNALLVTFVGEKRPTEQLAWDAFTAVQKDGVP